MGNQPICSERIAEALKLMDFFSHSKSELLLSRNHNTATLINQSASEIILIILLDSHCILARSIIFNQQGINWPINNTFTK